MLKLRIPFLNPSSKPLPNETLGNSLENVQHAIDIFNHFDYVDDSFLERLNDDAKKIIRDMRSM